MPTSFIAQDIMAEHLLSHNAIVFLKDKPMRLRSGLEIGRASCRERV